MARQLGAMDPTSLAISGYLARRYDLVQLAGAGDEGRRRIRAGDHGGGGSEILGAMLVAGAPRPSSSALQGVPPYERAIAAAQYCRPSDAASLLAQVRRVAAAGGYSLTHAAIAFEIGWERRCVDGGAAARARDALVTAMVHDLSESGAVNDLTMERVAMLAMLGAPLPVRSVRSIAAAQGADASWVDPTGRVPEWHPTMLGTWVLSAAAGMGAPVPFVAPESGNGGSAAGVGQFPVSEAGRLPAVDAPDRRALARLSGDPAPSAMQRMVMQDAMNQVGPAAVIQPAGATARTVLEHELAAATDAARRWSTPAAARRAGFRLASRFLPGIGAHWVDWSRVTRPFAAGQPAMLLFDGNGDGARLVGLSYLVRSRSEPEGFRSGGARWHRHAGLCILHGVLVGEGMRRADDCRGTYLPGRDLWMLHVWAVPGFENPWGRYASMNPKLCDAIRACAP
ncbi:MAG: hypothetical protein ACXVK4_00780 [Acidimicrobiia bacterium]